MMMRRFTCVWMWALLVGSVLCHMRAWPREMDDDPPVEKKNTYAHPADVAWIHEGDIFALRKKHDVLAVLVIQPYTCPKCEMGHAALLAAREKIFGDESGHVDRLMGGNVHSMIKLGVLDAEDEAPEFISLFHDVDEENFRQKVPCLIVFKQHHQDVLKKPPILFSYSEANLNKNLASFLVRLAGPDVVPVTTEAQLMLRMSSRYTNRASVIVWGDTLTKVQEQVAVEGRFDVFWSIVSSPAARAALAPKFNPNQYDIVFYFYKGKFNEDHLADDITAPVDDVLEMRGIRVADVAHNESRPSRRDDKERRAVKRMFEDVLALRPGQEFDRITKPTIIDDTVPDGCAESQRASRIGDRVKVQIVGRLVSLGDEFANTYQEVLTVGMSRGDFPDVLLREGLEGLCVGSKRRFAVPASQAYTEDMLPPGVRKDARVVYHIELFSFADDDALDSSAGITGAVLSPAGDDDSAHNPPEL